MTHKLATPPNHPSGMVTLSVSPAALLARVKAIEEVRDSAMQQDVHYYSLDAEDKKDRRWSLSKAGAEMLQLAFGLRSSIQSEVVGDNPTASITVTREQWTDGPNGRRVKVPVDVTLHGYYEVKSTCTIYSQGGEPIATASGSSNSHETAFRSTSWADAKNPILKRAEKRAFVAATLMATGSSGMFTQDREDMPRDGGQQADSLPKAEAGPKNGLSEKQCNLAFVKAKDVVEKDELDAFMAWFKAIPKGAKNALDDLIAGGDRAKKAVAAFKKHQAAHSAPAPAALASTAPAAPVDAPDAPAFSADEDGF